MIRFNRFNRRTALCALLACLSLNAFNLTAWADEIQDANKLFKQGQNTQALNKIDNILLNQPKDAQARFLKGVILTEQGQTEEATRIYLALTEDYPELPEPYNNLAVLYAAQGQYDKAKLALEKALRTHPSYAAAHENLGDIYAKMASQAYDRALQLDRSSNTTKTRLALVKDLYNPPVKSSNTRIQVASAAPSPANTAKAAPVVVASSSEATSPAISKSEPVAAKPVTVDAKAASPADEVLKAVQNWASAWSARNANKYLAMYAKDFKVPNNETRSNWEQQRRDRIAKPQPIAVTISNPVVKMRDDSHAEVKFVQTYRSGALNSMTRKTLDMIKSNGTWLILTERSGA